MIISINKKQHSALSIGGKVRLQLNKLAQDCTLKVGERVSARVMSPRGGNDIACGVVGVQNYTFTIKIGRIKNE